MSAPSSTTEYFHRLQARLERLESRGNICHSCHIQVRLASGFTQDELNALRLAREILEPTLIERLDRIWTGVVYYFHVYNPLCDCERL